MLRFFGVVIDVEPPRKPATLEAAYLSGGEIYITTIPSTDGFDFAFDHVEHAMVNVEGSFVHSVNAGRTKGIVQTDLQRTMLNKLSMYYPKSDPDGNLVIPRVLVFRCVDPLLQELIQQKAKEWASHNAQTHVWKMRASAQPEDIILDHGSALYRALRAETRMIDLETPFSREQGVNCAMFAATCIQQAILSRLFKDGIPALLLSKVEEIENFKIETGQSKFLATEGIKEKLAELIQIFQEEIQKSPPMDIPSDMLKKYQQLLITNSKVEILLFFKNFIDSGVFVPVGMLAIQQEAGGQRLAAITAENMLAVCPQVCGFANLGALPTSIHFTDHLPQQALRESVSSAPALR